MTNGRTALVVGAAGGIGGEMTRVLAARGWAVRALTRRAGAGEAIPGVTRVIGDAMSAGDVVRAAEGVELIVHAVNPPGYRRWGELVLPMLDSTLSAARASGARILLPGTVYNYGPNAGDEIDETAPRDPRTRKGRIREEMERRLERFAASGAGSVLVVRAGDFFGPRAGNNWFAGAMVTAGRRPRSMVNPGRFGIGHQWAYLPDAAEAMARLAERGAELGSHALFHLGGYWDADGMGMVAAIRRALGGAPPPVRAFPWWAVAAFRPFVPLFSELHEMRYLWKRPSRLVNTKLVAFLGEEPRTPIDRAVRETLLGLGCLGGAA